MSLYPSAPTGTYISVRLLQEPNIAPAYAGASLPLNVAVIRFSQFWKAPLPSVTREPGTSILSNEVKAKA